jgi:hypothetical protein
VSYASHLIGGQITVNNNVSRSIDPLSPSATLRLVQDIEEDGAGKLQVSESPS